MDKEKPSKKLPEYGQELLDTFYREGSTFQKEREEYLRLGLIPTINLRLYITEGDKAEIEPGFSNPYYYGNPKLNNVIMIFKDNNPELW